MSVIRDCLAYSEGSLPQSNDSLQLDQSCRTSLNDGCCQSAAFVHVISDISCLTSQYPGRTQNLGHGFRELQGLVISFRDADPQVVSLYHPQFAKNDNVPSFNYTFVAFIRLCMKIKLSAFWLMEKCQRFYVIPEGRDPASFWFFIKFIFPFGFFRCYCFK